MSLHSMTGYGRGVASQDGLRVEVELSAVNRRQLDVHIHLPRSISVLESRVQEEVGHFLHRGRITGAITVAWSAKERKRSVKIDRDLASAYIREIRTASAQLDLDPALDASLLLSLPEVIQYKEPSEDLDKVWTVIQKALRKALGALSRMRAREGRSLQLDLQQRLSVLQDYLKHIKTRAPKVVDRYRSVLVARLKKAGFAVALEDERLLREVMIFADRSDITEELTRLASHMTQARKLIRSKEAATGRSLDFLVQEMFREINTIGSKANDAAIVKQVVEFKSELERLREQIQNIE